MKTDTTTPSQQLSSIDSNMTKMIRIEGSYMYSNPMIDVVFDKNGNFYSNKKNDGYKLLTGKKVHYVLNANGKIVKGNTTKTSLLRTLLGTTTMPEFKLEVTQKTTQTSKSSKNNVVTKTASVELVSSKLLNHIKNIESELANLKSMIQ